MRFWRGDWVSFIVYTTTFAAAGCGGSSNLKDACERSCERTVKCAPEFGTLAECKQQCANADATAAARCITAEKVDACLAKTSCDQYLDCAFAETFCPDGAGGQAGTLNGGGGGSGAGGTNVGGGGGLSQGGKGGAVQGGRGGGNQPGGGGSAGTTGSVLPLGELPNDLAKVTCKRLFECCTTSEFSVFFDTQADCVSDFRRGISSDIAIVQDLIDAGHVKYRGDLAAACVARIEKSSCANAVELIEGFCVEAIEGLVKTGSACEDTLECVSGICTSENGNRTPTCASPPALGEMCLQTCAQGLGCDLGLRKCVATKPLGAFCQGDSVCQSDYCEDGKCTVFPLSCTGK